MLSNIAESLVDVLGFMVSEISLVLTIAVGTGVGLGYVIGQQNALADVQHCQNAAQICTVTVKHSAFADWYTAPVAKKEIASSAK